jgi:hypothetical protein
MSVKERLIASNLVEKFTKAKTTDQDYAVRILKWLEVDAILVKKIVDSNFADEYC